MDWMAKMPNFPSEDWVEIKPADLFLDLKDGKTKICPLGTAPKNFLMGMVIFYRNKIDDKFILLEYRNLQGKIPFLLRWGYTNTEGLEGIAIYQKKENKWQVKKMDEYLKWEIKINDEEDELISFAPLFMARQRSELN